MIFSGINIFSDIKCPTRPGFLSHPCIAEVGRYQAQPLAVIGWYDI